MSHKAIFFNFAHWGEEGKRFVEENDGLKTAGVEVAFVSAPLDATHIPADTNFNIAVVFIDSKVDGATIAALPNLKLIATLSTGFDHIDLETAVAKGITVSSVPSYGEQTVAEFAFALLLALTRKVCEARESLREGKFLMNDFEGTDLAGKTFGVVGTGRIGKHAVRMAKGFGMNVIAYDVYHDDAFAKEMGFPYVSLEELLAQSDVVSLHCPYLPSTHHLINAQNIGLIKKGAYLINTARGAVVETQAVVEALQRGLLSGAGLDVFEEESAMAVGDMSAVRELLTMPNVILTPHTGFNTRESSLRILDTTFGNIAAFTAGAPTNVVK
ncbi:MAG: hypothetical protein A2945_04575 [Candidatus Liptonbacteria bacterium RIFCSPLOWO2_01_FULL_52_25]|uniref:Hydroxyacid dehydrogenase n=1 Tax=Candidatus Liptonbacteria bacterium RIFCSPLOWO2_01_FULL_52_25 TaxID=1798650 RepID=A0A1G2CFU6_9BACT|nr:MAG: hypothetical protein A2945_04575 [Candidatus Liptonbacteria bacterium RIFCSPLOWO2_01_FULL_52_25]